MSKQIQALWLLLFVIPLWTRSGLEPGEVRLFPLGPTESLSIRLDPAWKSDYQNKPQGEAELNLGNPADVQEKCRIYVIPLTRSPDHDALLALLRENGAALLKKAVETDFTFLQLPGSQGQYYILTDKAPKPGEPVLFCRGALADDRRLILFSILFSRRDSDFFQKLLTAIASARIERRS